jgi:TonB family protein
MLRRVLGVIAGVAAAGATPMLGAAAQERPGGAAGPTQPILFDLPAQPLESALESYSVASGWQVVYNARLAIGRRSTEVKGSFTPGAALAMLLTGTGLTPQYKATDGILLAPDPAATLAPDEIADDVDPSFNAYYGLIQSRLKRAFCASAPIRAGAYRIALGFWIGSSGAVTQMALLGSTGRADVDESFGRAVRSLSVGAPPPAGFAQPVVLLVTPDLVSQCGGAAAAAPIRAAR